MRCRFLMLLACSCLMAQGTMLDRTAIIVGAHAVLESQIARDIRVTGFLNHDRLDFSPAARKKAANRLIDQEIIREQIRSGDYPVATEAGADQLLSEMQKERGGEAAFGQALARYGINQAILQDRLLWQMTVLRFIDARFRPAVTVSNDDVEKYYAAHQAGLRRAYPQAQSAADLRAQIEQTITGDRINQLLDDWLRQERRRIRIEYLEKSLQ